MSNRLLTEVMEYAPPDLSSAELALLLILADKSTDEDRMVNGRRIPARCCFPGMEQLSAWMRMSADGVGKVLRKLESRGLQVRTPIGTDTAARPIYAAKGHSTLYRVPELAKALPDVLPSQGKGLPVGLPFGNKGLPVVFQWPATYPPKVCLVGDPKPKEPKLFLPQTPNRNMPAASTPATAATGGATAPVNLIEDLKGRYPGMAHDEAAWIVGQAHDDPATKKPASRLKEPTYIADLRAKFKTYRDAARRDALRSGPKCEDHPESAAASCPGCRGDVNAGDRDRRFIGKHQPTCSVPKCWAPIIDQPNGATVCGDHSWAMGKGAA